MARFTTMLETAHSPEAAFDLLADMRNASRWDPGVAEATLVESPSDGTVGEGTTFDVTLRIAGRLKHVTYRLSSFERPSAWSSKPTIPRSAPSTRSRSSHSGPRGRWSPTAPSCSPRASGERRHPSSP